MESDQSSFAQAVINYLHTNDLPTSNTTSQAVSYEAVRQALVSFETLPSISAPPPGSQAFANPLGGDSGAAKFPFGISFSDLDEGGFPILPENVVDPYELPSVKNNIAHLAHLSLLFRLVDPSSGISSTSIASRLSDSWKSVHGDVTMDEMGNYWLLFSFANQEDRDYVWHGRPYYVQGKLLITIPFVKEFNPISFTILHADVWVRIPFLPYYLQNEPALQLIISKNGVGNFIKADTGSSVINKHRFARLCMNTRMPNPPGFIHILHFDKSVLTFVLWYEGFSPGCGCCGSLDHLFDDCFLNNLNPKAFIFAPAFTDREAHNAHTTRMKFINALLSRPQTTTSSSKAPPKGPNIVRRLAQGYSQLLIEGKRGQKSKNGNGSSKAPKATNNLASEPGIFANFTPQQMAQIHPMAFTSNPPLYGKPSHSVTLEPIEESNHSAPMISVTMEMNKCNNMPMSPINLTNQFTEALNDSPKIQAPLHSQEEVGMSTPALLESTTQPVAKKPRKNKRAAKISHSKA